MVGKVEMQNLNNKRNTPNSTKSFPLFLPGVDCSTTLRDQTKYTWNDTCSRFHKVLELVWNQFVLTSSDTELNSYQVLKINPKLGRVWWNRRLVHCTTLVTNSFSSQPKEEYNIGYVFGQRTLVSRPGLEPTLYWSETSDLSSVRLTARSRHTTTVNFISENRSLTNQRDVSTNHHRGEK